MICGRFTDTQQSSIGYHSQAWDKIARLNKSSSWDCALAGLWMQRFNIVSRHNTWLAVRQTAIGSNIANANTTGFRAQDVQPFEMAVEQARLALAATQPGHLAAGPKEAPTIELRREEPWEVTHSGNNVSLEQELLKAGEVNRAFRLNTSVAKAFHRMIMTSAKV